MSFIIENIPSPQARTSHLVVTRHEGRLVLAQRGVPELHFTDEQARELLKAVACQMNVCGETVPDMVDLIRGYKQS